MSRRPPETPHMLQCPLSGGPTRLPTHQPVHSASDANSRFVVSVFRCSQHRAGSSRGRGV